MCHAENINLHVHANNKKGSVICSVIRYEDFSASPVASTASLLQFLGFDIDANVKDFLAQHTVAKLGGEYSTYR